ncbi:DJ-1/PfpI family protein [Aquabacter sp. CN5-332]|uniref:DJ-1/PfpI family protein n=1 Tax=Aquabacter sp. CN5-332 TaxID=3156608 RepID=UPI0032B469C4
MALRIVMLAYPDMTQLDLTAPFEVFTRLPEAEVQLVWKKTKPIKDASGLTLVPDAKFSKVDGCDVLFVPGGPGQLPLMEDEETLAFLRRMAAGARYVTSVCTGSLILAAAGLLMGYRATCHWLSLEQLSFLGATPVAERVVVDRNRITGAGVTSGIDFALTMAREIAGENEARRIGLAIEYDPRPPFPSLGDEDPRLVEEVRLRTAVFQQRRAAVARTVGERLLNNPDFA